MTRPQRIFRLNYWNSDPKMAAAISVLGSPNEVRVAAGPKSFISVRDKGITLSAGFPAKINIQALPSAMNYAGMVQDLPFPLSLLPSTIVSPFPKQIIKPPFMELIKQIVDISTVAGMFL